MFVDWLLASFHHLAVFSLAAILSAEIFLTAGPIDDRLVLRIARIDAWFGLVAALVVAAGVLRVFFGAKGYAKLHTHMPQTAQANHRQFMTLANLPMPQR